MDSFCSEGPVGCGTLGVCIPDFDAIACVGEGVGEVDGTDGLADAALGVDDADDGAHGFSNLFLCIYSLAEKQKSVYKDFSISLFLHRFSPSQDLTERGERIAMIRSPPSVRC